MADVDKFLAAAVPPLTAADTALPMATLTSAHAGANGDLDYIVGVEHTTTSAGDGAPEAYALRVTTVFRSEDGEWQVVHRHAADTGR